MKIRRLICKKLFQMPGLVDYAKPLARLVGVVVETRHHHRRATKDGIEEAEERPPKNHRFVATGETGAERR